MEFVQNANNYITTKIKYGVLDFNIKTIRSILCEVRS